jgi:hypothetical protein
VQNKKGMIRIKKDKNKSKGNNGKGNNRHENIRYKIKEPGWTEDYKVTKINFLKDLIS